MLIEIVLLLPRQVLNLTFISKVEKILKGSMDSRSWEHLNFLFVLFFGKALLLKSFLLYWSIWGEGGISDLILICFIKLFLFKEFQHFQFSASSTWKSASDIILPISVICTGLAYGLGVGPVLFALLGEILQLNNKSFPVALIWSIRNLMCFLILKLFPTIVK